MQKKVYLILVLVVALALVAWTVFPAKGRAAQFAPVANTADCREGADAFVGYWAEFPEVRNRILQICDFNLRMNSLDSNISTFNRRFIEHAIVGNMIEVQSLEFALQHVQNEEWRGLIQMMIAMHNHDLEMAIAAAERLGLDTSPDLTNARVYPETPEYDLGLRRVDLVAKFLDPLMNAAGPLPTETPTAVPTDVTTGTPTAIPTDGTGTPTTVPTDITTQTPTAVPTDATFAPPPDGTQTSTPTDVATTTPTAVPPDGTSTPTAVPTDVTMTAIPTDFIPGTATAVPTGSPTPTPGNGTAANFDMVSLHIIEEQHDMHVAAALAAQRLVTNDEVRAFAKHSADVAGLHLLLIHDLIHRLFDQYTPPPLDFQREYQPPRIFKPQANEIDE